MTLLCGSDKSWRLVYFTFHSKTTKPTQRFIFNHKGTTFTNMQSGNESCVKLQKGLSGRIAQSNQKATVKGEMSRFRYAEQEMAGRKSGLLFSLLQENYFKILISKKNSKGRRQIESHN